MQWEWEPAITYTLLLRNKVLFRKKNPTISYILQTHKLIALVLSFPLSLEFIYSTALRPIDLNVLLMILTQSIQNRTDCVPLLFPAQSSRAPGLRWWHCRLSSAPSCFHKHYLYQIVLMEFIICSPYRCNKDSG